MTSNVSTMSVVELANVVRDGFNVPKPLHPESRTALALTALAELQARADLSSSEGQGTRLEHPSSDAATTSAAPLPGPEMLASSRHSEAIRRALYLIVPTLDEREAAEAALVSLEEQLEKFDGDRRTAMGAAERFREQGLADAARAAELEEQFEVYGKALREIAGSNPNVDGIHWVGDELNPELCPGCIAQAALAASSPASEPKA